MNRMSTVTLFETSAMLQGVKVRTKESRREYRQTQSKTHISNNTSSDNNRAPKNVRVFRKSDKNFNSLFYLN